MEDSLKTQFKVLVRDFKGEEVCLFKTPNKVSVRRCIEVLDPNSCKSYTVIAKYGDNTEKVILSGTPNEKPIFCSLTK